MSDEKKEIETIKWTTTAGDIEVTKLSKGLKVNNTDAKKLLSEHGATPEVVDAYMKAVAGVTDEAVPFLAEQVDAKNPEEPVKLFIGAGNGQIDLAVTAKRTGKDGKNPRTGEPYEGKTTYGVVNLGVKMQIPKVLVDEGGSIAKFRADCTKRFGTK